MLKQASLKDLRNGTIDRSKGYIVITMRYYPRFIRKDLRDEYLCSMAPSESLLGDFNSLRRRLGNHDLAFRRVNYERRFRMEPEGFKNLARLVELSKKTTVYLLCQCTDHERCHREMLLLVAQKIFGVRTGPVRFQYPEFEKRLEKMKAKLPL